jgi:hypothetical protein
MNSYKYILLILKNAGELISFFWDENVFCATCHMRGPLSIPQIMNECEALLE